MTTTIDQQKLQSLIESYKADFPQYIGQEIYKWRAIAHFQKYWDIEAEDFTAMLKRALDFKDDNLLAGAMYFPKRMIWRFAEFDEGTVRQMFVILFDEEQDLVERINAFTSSAEDINNRRNPNSSHYQDLRAISTYLWLMFPNKYYIYKASCVTALTSNLGIDFKRKKNVKGQNVVNAYEIYNQVAEALQMDEDLKTMLDNALSNDCYPDPFAKTLAVDFGYYLDKKYLKSEMGTNVIENKMSDTQSIQTSKTSYSKEAFLKEVYISTSEYDHLCALLERKKNVILQGAPGVGKTFTAKRLAYAIMGEMDESRIEFVQFHQNYSYEDFVMGYKPTSDGGFELRAGVFHKFCNKAANDPNRKYFFIIDEINRGNLSKIFGELLMLIESDYRYKEDDKNMITLAYSDKPFSVPSNLYIIGMMNTADRSLAMIDYALRRRFSFFSMKPGFESEGFKEYQKVLNNDKFNALINKIKELNARINELLGSGFEIGHSYFCNQTQITDKWLHSVVNYDIIPMLEEYWFDNSDEVNKWRENLTK